MPGCKKLGHAILVKSSMAINTAKFHYSSHDIAEGSIVVCRRLCLLCISVEFQLHTFLTACPVSGLCSVNDIDLNEENDSITVDADEMDSWYLAGDWMLS